MDAANLQQPNWVAMPDEEDEEAEGIRQQASSISATVWWLFTSLAMLAGMLLMAETVRAPWWLIAVVAAETYASLRRVLLRWSLKDGDSGDAAVKRAKRQRRLRHFTSMRLVEGAPVDEIVARWLALDALTAVRCSTPSRAILSCDPYTEACPVLQVRTLELGSNMSREGKSREHTLGLMATFAGARERDAFLSSPERAAFVAFTEAFVEDTFVFDFESGLV